MKYFDSQGNEIVSNKNVELACRRQEKKNLREKHSSLCWVSIYNHLRNYSIELRDGNIRIMKVGWREHVKTL